MNKIKKAQRKHLRYKRCFKCNTQMNGVVISRYKRVASICNKCFVGVFGKNYNLAEEWLNEE